MARRKARLPDWLFGAAGKRLLLLAVLADPVRSWSQAELARSARLGRWGSVDEHLAALVQMQLLTTDGLRYTLNRESPLVGPISALLAALDGLPDDPVDRP